MPRVVVLVIGETMAHVVVIGTMADTDADGACAGPVSPLTVGWTNDDDDAPLAAWSMTWWIGMARPFHAMTNREVACTSKVPQPRCRTRPSPCAVPL